VTRFLVDAAYLSAALVTSPVWIYRMAKSGKLRTDWRARFGRVTTPRPRGKRPRLLIHAVSVGEVNAIRLLVEALAADPLRPEIVVAATTDTGFARAQALFAQGASGPSATGAASVQVVRYPFDASWAVSRFLDAVKPDLVALVELEVWPNFTAACATRGIPCVVVNGRLSERSFRRYRIARPVVSPSFQRLLAVSAQSDAYAERFTALGVARGSVFVGGTMKWDTAEIADRVAGAEDLARELGIDRTRPLVVAGSTAPGEETIIANALPAEVQLLIAPRKPEWFDGVAAALDGVARRSRGERGSPTGRFLLDTIGELRKAYALADLVIVGRSFGNLHGSDMMEPIALGKATLIGPRSGDFRDMMDALREGQGIVETTAERLGEDIRRLLGDSDARAALAARGRAVIRSRQGATRRNAELLLSMLPSPRVDASTPAPAPTEPSSASHA
jgi:3-deoxy-D-manno-octulosonic-acid transferase